MPSAVDIGSKVSAVPCSVLASNVDGAQIALGGYTADKRALEKLRVELAAGEGVGEVSTTGVRALNPVYCRVLETLAPQIKSNWDAGLLHGVRTAQAEAKFVAGDRLAFSALAPAIDSYITVDYYSLDGQVVHMLPSGSRTNNRFVARSGFSVGAGDGENWIVGPPFGTEVITLIASSEPLFPKPRKEAEPADRYLKDLRRSIERIQARPGSTLLADVMLIETRAKEQ